MRFKRILYCYAASIFLMLVFPPFAIYMDGGRKAGYGYHFISFDEHSASINVEALALQLVAATLIALAFRLAENDQIREREFAIAARLEAERIVRSTTK